MTKHFEPEPFIDRDDIAAAIHRRPPMPCFDFVRARKMVVAYPSLKDRIRFHLGRFYGASVKEAATQCIAALGEPYGKRLLRPARAGRSAEPPALKSRYRTAVERLTKAVEAADAVDTETHYKLRALDQVDTLCATLARDRDFKVKTGCGDGVRELVKAGHGATPRIRMRWEQFPHNHSIALIEDFSDADAARENGRAGRTAFTNFLTDAFTSLSEHLARAPDDAQGCRCPNRFACQPRDAKCPNRGDRREALFRHLVPNDHSVDPTQRDQPGFGQLVVADYWIVPLQSFVDIPDVKKFLEFGAGLSACDVAHAVERLRRRGEAGVDGEGCDATALKLVEGVAAWAKAWFKIRDYSAADLRDERRDFVCSHLSDHRCLLLSDLRPDANGAGDREYTEYESRSIIIDFGMHEEERGRVLQRLMDIAAFRQLGLRGLPYVRQATNTITRLGVTLNALNATSTDDGHDSRAKLRVIERLTASMDLLNLFFTYGVTGRRESLTRASLRVSKNVGLLREARIPGHQTLAGYLERYFWTANDIEVMRSRYANLRSRIDNAANLVKAEFERKQSDSITTLTRIAILISAIAAFGAVVPADLFHSALVGAMSWVAALLAWPTA